jgi:tRNA (guanine37-N1)-methyltransferase
MKCVKVEKNKAQEIKKELIDKGILSKDYIPVKGNKYIYFPINKEIKGYDTVNKECKKIIREYASPSAYDQVGDIIILGEKADKSIAQELIKRKNIKVILQKKGIHHGEFRTQDMVVLAGEKRKETTYTENAIKLKLNVETCYFSSRLSTERKRVADLVQDNEKVLVLFSGVAPYPLVIAKHSNPSLIVAVEKNPEAHKYAMENCKKYQNIALFNMDAKEFTYKEKFDRVLMPLPKSAEDFLTTAKKLTKKGGTIHFYDFIHERDFPKGSVDKIKEKIKTFKILKEIKCGKYAPGKFRVCIDIQI